MATSITAAVTCSHCGKEHDIQTYPNINVKESPELKARIKDGTLFLWTCPDCGQVNLAPYQTLYHDPDEKVMIWLTPNSMSFSERALVDSHIQAIAGQLAEDKSGELLRGYALRRVKEAGELIEKVNIFDAGLDEIAMEMCKYITKM